MDRVERRRRQSRIGGTRGGAHTIVGPLVGELIKHHPSFSANPIGDWVELVGDPVARYCQPRSLKEKVLVVVAYDSVWKYHLDLHREALLEKINMGRAEPLIEKIVVRVGELTEAAAPLNSIYQDLEKSKAGKTRAKKRKKLSTRPLMPDEKTFLKGLRDPDLRAMGARLLKRIPLENQ
jgi:hypothetical protein